jgi:hypothetical protein
VPTYKECNEQAQTLRERAAGLLELAAFIETEGVRLPDLPYIDREALIYVWLTKSDSYKDEDGKWQSRMNESGTKANIRRFLEAVGTCEKDYRGDRLEIKKRFGNVSLIGNVNREVACRKTEVKKVWVEPSKGYFREEVEWDCDTPSLLALVKED